MATKQRSAHLKQVVDLVADAFVEGIVAGFSYGVEIRAQIYEDLEAPRQATGGRVGRGMEAVLARSTGLPRPVAAAPRSERTLLFERRGQHVRCRLAAHCT